jgi:chemotaxis protein CheX
MFSTQTAIDMHREQMVQLFGDVFRTMLRIEISPEAEEAAASHLAAADPVVTSAVYFAGSWKGATLLECSLDTAIFFTGRLMSGSDPSGFDDDVRDCLGELANMLGGNIKAILPDGVELSIPTVIEGRNYSVRLCGAHSFARMPFASEAGPFVVILVEAGAAEDG